ncbi:MAG: flagellar hook-associated protein FlgK [Myxococcales bacterium]|nr:flagellar hook-associated protein FlgK [Myxococcales bacterium]
MASLTYIMSMARDALIAQSAGTAITGENVSNASTPGYVRRSARLESMPLDGGTRGVGGGVHFAGVDRAFERFAYRAVVRESGHREAAAARHGALNALEGALVPPGAPTLGDRLDAVLGAFETLSSKADDPTARASVAAAAAELAAGFQAAADTLDQSRSDLLQRAQGVAVEVNRALEGIARLNAELGTTPAHDAGRPALLDQRDELVRAVGGAVDVSVLYDDLGRATLLSAGSTLVEGNRAATVTVAEDANRNLQITYSNGGHGTDVTAKLAGGSLAGIAQARDLDIPALANALDALAFDFASAVNAAHTAGYGLDGGTGRALFTAKDGTALTTQAGAAHAIALNPLVAANHDAIAAAALPGDLPGGSDVAVAIGQLSHQPISALGTPTENYSAMMGLLGTALHQAGQALDLRNATLGQAEQRRQSASGVSLEEEMVNLTRYQRAFEAAMRVLKTADEMLGTLIREL